MLPAGRSTSEKIGREEEICREFALQASRKFHWEDDAEVLDYVKEVGAQIVSRIPGTWYRYSFQVLRDSSVNAFAVPGGYVCVCEGLLAKLESVDELAGVLAHEVAHVEGNHYLLSQEKLSVVNVVALAAMILGAVAGGGQQAAAVGSLAYAAQTTLALQYSRDHEREADRTGIRLCQAAGFAPGGFVSLLQRLEKEARLDAGSLPPYLSTHPMPAERLFEVQSWIEASGFPSRIQSKPLGFDLARISAKLHVQGPKLVLAEQQVGTGKHCECGRAHFLLGYLHMKMGELGPARSSLEEALLLDPSEADYALYLARVYLLMGHLDEARNSLAGRCVSPANSAAMEVLCGDVAEEVGDREDALRHYLRAVVLNPDSFFAQRNLAMAYGRRGKTGKAYLHTALAEVCAGRRLQAVQYLRMALRELDPNGGEALSAREEIERLTGMDRNDDRRIKNSSLRRP